jgi:hypothetical protein
VAEIEWRPVVGYEGLYEVSSLGDVRGITRWTAPRILKPFIRSGPYSSVRLFRDGIQRAVRVHRVVALAFHPNPDGLPLVRHRNDVPADNRAENLTWGTQKDNADDALRNGRRADPVTRCRNGHELTPANTKRRPDRPGDRRCRTCANEASRAWRRTR